ncbi:MAG: antibiotic biosynthesis monooxygenase [Anaerolineales bacterium]|nr:antibiotic biosynthesis monooxygenase [Anaerolineales bacterium]
MYTVFVHIQVKPDDLEAFKQATLKNVTNSRLEPGVFRFDFFQEVDDPTRFILVEVYRSQQSAGKHKETGHYKKWRDIVEAMMAKPRQGIKYLMINPE